MSGTSTTRIFRRSFHNHLLKKVEKLASRIAALGQCLRPHHVSYNYHRNKALYYIGFRKGKISPFSKNSFYFQPAPSSQKALTHQAILTWQNDSIGKFAKLLYIQDFSRAKNEVSSEIFFENSQAVSSSQRVLVHQAEKCEVYILTSPSIYRIFQGSKKKYPMKIIKNFFQYLYTGLMSSVSVFIMRLCDFYEPLYYIGFGEGKLQRKIESILKFSNFTLGYWFRPGKQGKHFADECPHLILANLHTPLLIGFFGAVLQGCF